MRIGFFTDTFVPQVNGVVTALDDFGSELVRRGHSVHVFCPDQRKKDYAYNGMRVHSYRAVKFRPYPDYLVGLPLTLGRVPALDVVHTHGPFSFGWYGLRAAKSQGIPRMSTFHTLLSEFSAYLRVPEAIYRRLSWGYLRFHYNRYNLLTAPSLAIKGMLEEHGFKPPVEVLPNGVDTRFFRPVKNARNRLGIDADRVFLYVGRLSYEKGVDALIRASGKFLGEGDALVIVGKGPAAAKLREQAKGDRRIIFTGYVENGKLPAYYSAADAFLTASDIETQGLTALEAMACGCPVIGKNALATPEVVESGKNGYLWDSRAELVRIVNGLTPSRLSKLSKNAKKTAREYSVQRCTDRLEKLYGLMAGE